MILTVYCSLCVYRCVVCWPCGWSDFAGRSHHLHRPLKVESKVYGRVCGRLNTSVINVKSLIIIIIHIHFVVLITFVFVCPRNQRTITNNHDTHQNAVFDLYDCRLDVSNFCSSSTFFFQLYVDQRI